MKKIVFTDDYTINIPVFDNLQKGYIYDYPNSLPNLWDGGYLTSWNNGTTKTDKNENVWLMTKTGSFDNNGKIVLNSDTDKIFYSTSAYAMGPYLLTVINDEIYGCVLDSETTDCLKYTKEDFDSYIENNPENWCVYVNKETFGISIYRGTGNNTFEEDLQTMWDKSFKAGWSDTTFYNKINSMYINADDPTGYLPGETPTPPGPETTPLEKNSIVFYIL